MLSFAKQTWRRNAANSGPSCLLGVAYGLHLQIVVEPYTLNALNLPPVQAIPQPEAPSPEPA